MKTLLDQLRLRKLKRLTIFCGDHDYHWLWTSTESVSSCQQSLMGHH